MATALDAMMQAASDVQQSSAGLAAKRQADAKASEDDVLAYIDAVGRASIAQRDQVRETDAMAAALDAAKAGIMEVRGGPARLQADLRKVMDQGAELEQATATLVAQNNKSILDIISDPVGTFRAIFDLDGNYEKVTGATRKLQASRAALQATHQTVVESVTQLETTKPTITAALAQARQEEMLAKSQAAIAQARIEGRKHGVDAYKAAVDADLTQLQVLGTIRGALISEEQLRMQREAAVAAADERNIRKTMLQLQQKELADAAARRDFYRSTIIRGMSSVGLRPPEGPGLDVLVDEAMKNPNSEAARNFNRGMMQLTVPGADNRVAATAWDAYNTIQNDTVNLPPETKEVQRVLSAAAEILQKSKAAAQLDAKKNPQEVAAAYDAAVKQVLDNEFADVRTDQAGLANPFPNLSTYVMASPVLSALPLTQKFLKPMIDQGVSISNPSALMKQGIAAVQAGTITSSDLINGMQAIAAGAMKQHLALSRATDFGLITPTTLNVRLSTRLGATHLVNLTDTAQVSRFVAGSLTPLNPLEAPMEALQRGRTESMRRAGDEYYNRTPR